MKPPPEPIEAVSIQVAAMDMVFRYRLRWQVYIVLLHVANVAVIKLVWLESVQKDVTLDLAGALPMRENIKKCCFTCAWRSS